MKSNLDSSLLQRPERINFFYQFYLLQNNDLDYYFKEDNFNFNDSQKEFIILVISKKNEIEDNIKKFISND
jgi:hypothetical protein